VKPSALPTQVRVRVAAPGSTPDNLLVNVNLHSITVDCADPERMATFWAAALGWSVEGIDQDGAVITSGHPDMPRLLFLVVPELKKVKNRWHLDLQAATAMDAEVARLVSLGASVLRRVDNPDADVFTVMADVEKNEFCVEVSPAERAALEGSPAS
jgi:predicted enzyme related to lactoylglutathione lyase